MTVEDKYSITILQDWNIISFVFRQYLKTFYSWWLEKTKLNGFLYDFSVHYNITTISDIVDIHKYFRKIHSQIKFKFR